MENVLLVKASIREYWTMFCFVLFYIFHQLCCKYCVLIEAVIVGCIAGHRYASSSSITASGIFINAAFPAQCTGLVTSWNYCYYADMPLIQSFMAELGVWRNASLSSTLVMVKNSSLKVALQSSVTLASIVCKQISLMPRSAFTVQKGDYVGVILPLNNPIPMLGLEMVSDKSLLEHPLVPDSSSLSFSTFTRRRGVLHLYVNIGE